MYLKQILSIILYKFFTTKKMEMNTIMRCNFYEHHTDSFGEVIITIN